MNSPYAKIGDHRGNCKTRELLVKRLKRAIFMSSRVLQFPHQKLMGNATALPSLISLSL